MNQECIFEPVSSPNTAAFVPLFALQTSCSTVTPFSVPSVSFLHQGSRDFHGHAEISQDNPYASHVNRFPQNFDTGDTRPQVAEKKQGQLLRACNDSGSLLGGLPKKDSVLAATALILSLFHLVLALLLLQPLARDQDHMAMLQQVCPV